MKKYTYSLIATALLLVLSIAACKPDEPAPTTPSGTFQLEFAVTWGGTPLDLSMPYLAPDGHNYQIDVLKFYISRLQLLTPADSAVSVKDVALVDLYRPNSKVIAGAVPVGSYTKMRFNLGLDYDLNHSNQTSYATDHPLSTTTGMYWTWASRYIFSMIEGRSDTAIFLYHSGNDTLLRALEFENVNVVVADGETKKHTVSLDMQKVLFGANDTIDIHLDPITHTTDNPGLASRVTNLLVDALQ